ncbi:hypothetical protein NQ314_005231 [Rhamnusium bicolor]|uniref:EGF-like domain-containing protein n=1 Tax=Rhamnusium bicolor TaxID=1586634 RepID=A0AAV8ZIL4_9CUCU|nr:hypothetical protein NQ314_005231 [Rhamnusium bicolor]
MLYIEKAATPLIISENDIIEVISLTNEIRYFKFYVQDLRDHGILTVEDIYFAENVENLVIRIEINKPPASTVSQKEELVFPNTTSANILYWVKPNSWHYIEIKFQNETVQNKEEMSNLTFKIRYFSDILSDESNTLENRIIYNNSISKIYYNKMTNVIPYKHYDLVRESSTESFLFSFELEEELDSNVAVPINMTNGHFSLFKFNVREGSDTGGTLQFIMAFKPKIKRKNSRFIFVNEPEEHVIIACIRKGRMELPTWPNNCVSDRINKPAQLVLNKTVENSTILIPFPESGTWYATFKLFCGKCEPCNCSDDCQERYEACTINCELNCINGENCSYCAYDCRNIVIESESCAGCNCDGPCMKNENNTCNSSIVFDIGSQPCVSGRCSGNGRCMFMVSDGVVFSTCVCSNKYRGWDCSDDSLANPYYMVVIELLLLVLSNLMFLPAVYIAFKRKYYVESITYFSICFFSTFYHACDAGENIISFCLVRLSALQFADFFCALLAIWATIIALADLLPLTTSIFHMIGAIILAFCTTIDRTALWIFALPVLTGVFIVIISWYFKYRKVRQRFADKRYLYVNVPLGIVVVAVGLIMYAFLQTENNYKYLHSLWHIIMAVAIIIVLPKPNTFQPEILL